MPLLYFALFIVVLVSISSGHEENDYLDHLAKYYNEYEEITDHGLSIGPTKRFEKVVEDSDYYLFTRYNVQDPVLLSLNDFSSLNLSYIDTSLEVMVIVHGWGGDLDSELNSAIKEAILLKKPVNVIVVDWSQLSKQDYITAVRGVPKVGKHLGRFLTDLNVKFGTPFYKMHLVGHSLGAHVAGTAGRQLKGQLARITGLDPAGPLWMFNKNRLNSSDAVYVEALHTNSGVLGIMFNVADADFYANGGFKQPGCFAPTCSHARAWQLFAASITHSHLLGRKCSALLEAKFRTCRGIPYRFGTDDLQKNQPGIYALNTSSTYPY